MLTMNEAITARINELLEDKHMSLCDMALSGGLSPSTVYDLVKGRTKVPTVITISKLCDGAGITLVDFFDRPYFYQYFEN